jgi:2-alkenal reductase
MMDDHSRRFGCGALLMVMLLALLAGVLGGGAAGGSLAYYMAKQAPPPAAIPAPIVQTASQPHTSSQVITLQQNTAIVEAVRKVKPAVVTVLNTLRTRSGRGQATGTGVIVDAKGYIVTNNHVVEGAQKIEVLFENGDKAEAKLIGADAFSDLAVLQVTSKAMPAVAQLGDSSNLQVGEPVIAIGSALGNFRNTVTVGVVSGLNRRLSANDASSQEGMIQTDAAINHGNSGGPLLNAAGQVIGINTLVVRDASSGDVAEGLGFAIPVNTVKYVTAQLTDKGKVTRPFIGITYQMLNAQVAAANNVKVKEGAWIQDVTANSPAARAGLKAGDVITSINGAALTAEAPLPALMLKFKPGDTVQLALWRDGKMLTVSLTLAERLTAS